MFSDFGNIYKQAQQMQKKIQTAKEEFEKIEVCGNAGLDSVKVTMNGKFETIKVDINSCALEDKEILQELVVSAVNDAINKLNVSKSEHFKELNMPGMDILNNLKL